MVTEALLKKTASTTKNTLIPNNQVLVGKKKENET